MKQFLKNYLKILLGLIIGLLILHLIDRVFGTEFSLLTVEDNLYYVFGGIAVSALILYPLFIYQIRWIERYKRKNDESEDVA